MDGSRAPLGFLCAGVLIFGAGISAAQTASTPASNTPAQTFPVGSGANPFAGSVPTKVIPGILPLPLQDAIDRGLKHNLGLLLSRADTRAARGQRWEELSALLPHVSAAPNVAASKVNIDEAGLAGVTTLFHISPSVGPFSYFDARAGG